MPSQFFIEFFGKSWNRKRIRIRYRGFQTILSETLFYSQLIIRWTFPMNSLSIFQQCKVILFESLRSSCHIKFWLFSTKNDDFYFKSKKKFPDGTDLLDGWIFRVPPFEPLFNSNWKKKLNHLIFSLKWCQKLVFLIQYSLKPIDLQRFPCQLL